MPPRYVYWTIIVDGQPTAFRSGSLEDIMPTFNRLKEKQPTAELKWFQHGKLWPSRHDAQDFMRARGDRGRERDPRQSPDGVAADPSRSERPERAWNAKPEWKTRTSFSPASAKATAGQARSAKATAGQARVGTATAGQARVGKATAGQARSATATAGQARVATATARQAPRGDKPAWMSKDDAGDKPTWTPKGAVPEGRPFTGRRDEKPAWSPKGGKPAFATASSFAKASEDKPEGKPEWKPKGTFRPAEAGHRAGGGDKPTWTPKGAVPEGRPFTGRRDEKPAWSPKGEKPAFATATAGQARSDRKPEWKPKGTFKPKEPGHSTGWGEKPAFAKASAGQARSGGKPDWKPKGSPREQARATFRPKSYTPKGDVPEGRPFTGRQGDRPTWTPKGAARPGGPNAGFAKSESGDAPKRKWVPKAEYKKSLGIEAKRDDKWRPGGEHVDPKQKYKDAKKAKWTRVKATIRARSTGKPRKREE